MRKLPYKPYDKEDYQVMQQLVDERNKKYRRNEVYVQTSKEVIIQRPYDKLKKEDNGQQ